MYNKGKLQKQYPISPSTNPTSPIEGEAFGYLCKVTLRPSCVIAVPSGIDGLRAEE